MFLKRLNTEFTIAIEYLDSAGLTTEYVNKFFGQAHTCCGLRITLGGVKFHINSSSSGIILF